MNIIMYVNCIFLHFQDQNMQYHIEKKKKKKNFKIFIPSLWKESKIW